MVFEYGPVVFDNAEEFLETTDICILLHACDNKQALPIPETSMLSKFWKKIKIKKASNLYTTFVYACVLWYLVIYCSKLCVTKFGLFSCNYFHV